MPDDTPASGWKPPPAPRSWARANRTGQRGTKEQLARAGVPEAWLQGLPAPGRKRGARTIIDAGREVYVSVGESGIFDVQTTLLVDLELVEARRGRDFAEFLGARLGHSQRAFAGCERSQT